MSLRDYLRELAYPASSTATLIALVTFALLIGLVRLAGLFGIWLAVTLVLAIASLMVWRSRALWFEGGVRAVRHARRPFGGPGKPTR